MVKKGEHINKKILTEEERIEQITKKSWKRFYSLFPKNERKQLIEEFKNEEKKNTFGAITKEKYNIRKTPFKKEHDFITQLIPKRNIKKSHIVDVKTELQRISNDIASEFPDAVISIAINAPIGWRGCSFTKAGEAVRIYNWLDYYNVEDADSYALQQMIDNNYHVKDYRIYLYVPKTKTKREMKKEGGADGINNNCLWRALKKAYYGRENMPSKISSPKRMKKYLGLAQNAKVHYKYLSKIEDLAGTRINLSGDQRYISMKKYKKIINMNLYNGHYKLKPKQDQLKIKGVSFKERKVILYKIVASRSEGSQPASQELDMATP